MDKYIGKRLDGRYEIKELIGVGGMAYVYKAYDSIDDRVVAVKILKDEFLANEEFTRRFKNESKAIAILSHPNIVKVYDVSFGERLQYIVMEYIDGITLKEYIEQQKDIKWKEAVHFTVQILRALQHAHDKGIVHRDIKPQNIMLLPDGTIKVTDFGIARFSRTDIRATSATDKAIGSVHYISPEQARGEITDEKADIYSVGVMLYEMLTGRLPFEADNAVSVAIMQLQSEPKHPREINPQIPEGLEDITIKAMQKDPAKRYQTAAEMLYDIDEFKRNPSIHFEYTYFVDETPTRFVEAITRVKGEPDPEEPPAVEEDEEEEEEKKGLPVIPILAAVAGAFVLVALIFVGIIFVMKITDTNKVKDITVPNFYKMDYAKEIYNNPDYADLTIETENENSADIPFGCVVRQEPPANTSIKQNRTITLYLSTGPKTKSLRDVVGEDETTAKAHLEAEGFKVVAAKMSSDTVPVGSVVSTDPKPGDEIPEGSTVTIYVSTGEDKPDPVKVPKVLDMAQSDAEADLRSKGFRVEIVEKNSIYEKGVVIEQNPAPETLYEQGEVVTLTVSSGYRDVAIDVAFDSLPAASTTARVDFEVFVAGTKDAAQCKYDVVPADLGKLTLNLTTRQDKYMVRVKIAAAGAASNDFKDYFTCEVNGKTGDITNIYYNQYAGPTTPTGPTTEGTTPPTEPNPGRDD